jgi:hypothetical protein
MAPSVLNVVYDTANAKEEGDRREDVEDDAKPQDPAHERQDAALRHDADNAVFAVPHPEHDPKAVTGISHSGADNAVESNMSC